MKKKVLIAAFVAPLLLASCLGDPKDTTSTTIYPIYNMVVPTDGQKEITVSEGKYSLSFNITKQTVEMSADNLKIGDRTGSFLTPTVSYRADAFTTSFVADGGTFGNDASMPVNDINCTVYSAYYIVPTSVVIPDVIFPRNTFELPIMSYKVGDEYNVYTFYPYPVYGGTTVTTDDSGDKYEEKKMKYYFSMDTEKGKADLVIYDAKFSDKMPMSLKALVLKGLDLKFTRQGYEISGENIIPSRVEGNIATPMETFVFEKFLLTSTPGDITSGSAVYNVVNNMNPKDPKKYVGNFSGRYVYTHQDEQNGGN